MTTRTLRLIIIGAVVVAAVAAGVVILFQRAGRQAVTTSGAVTPVVVMSPAEVEAKYRQGLSQATATLKPLLARQLTVADQAQVAAVRDSLASLRVPVSSQAFHLALVLKVSLLAQLLAPTKAPSTAHSNPTLASVQADLQQLIAQVQ